VTLVRESGDRLGDAPFGDQQTKLCLLVMIGVRVAVVGRVFALARRP